MNPSGISGPEGIGITLFLGGLFAVAFIGMMHLVDKVVASFKRRRPVRFHGGWNGLALVSGLLAAKKTLSDLGFEVRRMEISSSGVLIEASIPEPSCPTEGQKAWFWYRAWSEYRVKYIDSAHYVRERSRLGFLKASKRLEEVGVPAVMERRRS